MSIRPTRNVYRVEGTVAILEIYTVVGTKVDVLIDVDDLERVLNFGLWYPWYSPISNRCYPRARGMRLLSRFIMGFPSKLEVDHINGNTLDNRKENLRAVTHEQNMQNVGPTKVSTTGVRGVSYDAKARTWRYTLQHGEKRYYKKGFKSLQEAEQAVRTLRKELGLWDRAA